MSHILTAAPASELTSGNQLFKCAPYNCTMLARACLERQAKAALGLEAITLLKCRGCELGAQVRGRVTDVTFTERELLRGARASGHQRNAGALGEKLKGARTKQTADAPMEKLSPRRALPIVGLEFVAPPTPVELPPAFATAPRISAPMAAEKTKPKEETEEPMPAKSVELKGKEIAGVKVLHQLPQVKGGKGSLWMVQFPCKHEEPVLGAVLTSYERNGSTRGCKICRASNEREAATASRAKAPRAKEPSRAPRPRVIFRLRR